MSTAADPPPDVTAGRPARVWASPEVSSQWSSFPSAGRFSAVGPLLLAERLERMGSYDSIFYGRALVVTVLGIGAWFVPLAVRQVLSHAAAGR